MRIAIIGLGYVGLPLSLQFSSSGVRVIGLDVDAKKVDALREGRSYIRHIHNQAIEEEVSTGRFLPATDLTLVEEAEAVVICVPTPLSKHREPDISYVLETARAIAPFLAGARTVETGQTIGRAPVASCEAVNGDEPAGGVAVAARRRSKNGWPPARSNGAVGNHDRAKLVVLESTTYPGTTDEDLRKVLEEGSGSKAGVGFHLAFSPEREDPANPESRVARIPKVVGGYTPQCLERAMELYGKAIDTLVPVSSCRAAEATKLHRSQHGRLPGARGLV
jgi:UDP-N-acetyl-D-glucosamine dehydrogenase